MTVAAIPALLTSWAFFDRLSVCRYFREHQRMDLEETKKIVAQVLLHELGAQPDLVSAGCLFSRDGLDSFDRLRLIDMLEERFGIKIIWQDIVPETFDSIDSISRLLQTMSPRASTSLGSSAVDRI